MVVNKKSVVPNSLAIPSLASFVVKIKTKLEVEKAINFARKEDLPIFVIGGGTNIIPHNYVKGVIVILNIKGIKLVYNRLKIQAGEKWDDVVKFAIKNKLSGIEALSWIPGKAGSAPIQNIGAYGVEIADVLEKVEVYDRKKEKFIFIPNKDCQFGYRNSLFKKHPDNFIITSVILKLSRYKPKMPKYKDVLEYFEKKKNSSPSLGEIRKAIIEIRKRKLPDPKITPNAGSYFINPFVKDKKVSASQLIEKVGLKGAKIGKIEMSPVNAMILTNPNKADFEEIMKAENFIKQKVFQKFGILLEREPRIIG
jgi:UDP-N-acetylmuramate dehydrogenase